MIVGSGIDLCEVPRIEQAIARHGHRFLERIFTPREIAYADRKANRAERCPPDRPASPPKKPA